MFQVLSNQAPVKIASLHAFYVTQCYFKIIFIYSTGKLKKKTYKKIYI